MKTLVVYYSKTGTCKNIAEKIAKNLKADIDEVIDQKDRSGIVGWVIGGRDALLKKRTNITTSKDPKKYDLVVIGTPIWAGTMTPAIAEYLNVNKLKKAAFFSTAGSSRPQKVIADMENLAGKPKAVMQLDDKSIKKDPKETEKSIKEFCKKLK